MGIPDVPFLWVLKVRFKTCWARNDWEQDMPKHSTCAHAARRLPEMEVLRFMAFFGIQALMVRVRGSCSFSGAQRQAGQKRDIKIRIRGS